MYAKFAGTIKIACDTVEDLAKVSKLLAENKVPHLVKTMVGFPKEPAKKSKVKKEWK